MGADCYTFISITAAAIPVPKEALQRPFDLQGFKLMTVQHECYNDELEEFSNEYHGAMICLEDTELFRTSIEVIGPYEIRDHQAECKRMEHLDAFMPADTRDRLANAFEAYTGRKPEVVPGFWTLSATEWYFVDLHTTWSLEAQDSIVGKNCERFCFSVWQDTDGNYA
ncbi:hypothetical protein BG015_000944 [Linnemannia schmuckeri]|uniref:Uncharacterized protein n=1 Tax=Linnemannia schmuckeri TaxID=64567 RepID=A0A9P5V7D9_9FUNG|nr:hypothetical protein BG015_000944 [Linnemannia schmuckeri]